MPNKKSGKKPKSTTKITNKPSKGLGDTIEKITTATGIKKAVEWLSDGEDCGCDKRRDFLNKMFPYKKPNCLQEDEYNTLKAFFNRENKSTISVSQQNDLSKIYQKVFNQRVLMSSSCGSCWRDAVSKLKKVYDEYGD